MRISDDSYFPGVYKRTFYRIVYPLFHTPIYELQGNFTPQYKLFAFWYPATQAVWFITPCGCF